MSTRPASPPFVARWKFFLGAILFLAVGTTVFLLGESPPDPMTMIGLLVCLAAGVMLFLAPYLIEYDARVRVAEAQARDHDHMEPHLRKLVQTADQLGQAISRSQSTEEQAGQALGALEELAEKLSAQVEELAQNLAQSQQREVAALKAEVDRLAHERDDRLAALEQRLDTATGLLTEQQLTARKTSAATARTLDELKERIAALAPRAEEPAPPARTAPRTPARERHADAAPVSAEPAPVVTADEPVIAKADGPAPAVTKPAGEDEDTSEPEVAATKTPAKAVVAHRPRVRRAPESPAPSRLSHKPQPLDLPLLDLNEARPIVHRDGSGGASTLVATAYIGIGNKLYVRGEGPGLSWDQGVPMQFLAIGKWGWTSPDAGQPITCRIYRNDETPMLDENIVIEPGAKTEVTPRF